MITVNFFLSTLSLLIAMVALYMAGDLVRCVARSTGRVRLIWHAIGALAIGGGLTAMNFVGMLALHERRVASIDFGSLAVSALFCIFTAAIVIHVGVKRKVSVFKVVLVGFLIGCSVISADLVGMVAIEAAAIVHYDSTYVVLSLAFAFLGPTSALWAAYRFNTEANRNKPISRIIPAGMTGGSIWAHHYASAAAITGVERFQPSMASAAGADQSMLAFGLGITALIVLGVTHLTLFFNYRIAIEKRIGEKAGRDAVEMDRLFIDSINEIYVIKQGTLCFSKANRSALENLGLTLEEIITMALPDIMPELHRDQLLATLLPIENGDSRMVTLETMHRRSDGSSYPASIQFQCARVNDEPVYIAYVRDVTERRHMEAQVAQAKKMQAMGRLAAGIAHEINTPVQFVSSNIQFMKESFADMTKLLDGSLSLYDAARSDTVSPALLAQVGQLIEKLEPDYLIEETPQAIEHSLEGMARIAKIVQSMKEYAHPGSDTKTPFEVNRTIANTIVVASNEWKYLAKLDTDLADDLPLVLGYANEIGQVVLNLIVNAAHSIGDKYKSSGTMGTITISTRAHDNDVEIRVQDDGLGIPLHIQKRVFDPFFTTKAVGKGSGQGLALAYSTIVDKHGGTIDLESTDQVGCTFIIRMPAVKCEVGHEREEVIA